MKVLSAFVNWINKDTMGRYDNRLLAVVIRSTTLVSILYYTALLTLFVINKQLLLGVYDFVGVLVLSYGLYLTYSSNIKYSFWIYEAAILLLVIFQSVYIGWDMGFQYSIFLLVLITFFTNYYSSVIKLLMTILYTCVFCGLYVYSLLCMPQVVILNNIDDFLTVLTAVYSFGCLAIAGFYFSAKSSGMDKKLMEYNKTLERLAFFDPLTGLFNRRQTLSFLTKKVEMTSKDENSTLSVVIGDIDFFKKVNDVYGHECGDIVLKGISHIISTHMKGKGLASRWGGEEFLMIYPEADAAKAAVFTQQMLDEIREYVVNYNGYPIGVTMSFGVQQYRKGITVDEFICLSDKKLYAAKKSGRNCIVTEQISN